MRILLLTSRLDYAAERTLDQLLKIKNIEIVGVLKEKFSFRKIRNIRKTFRIFEGMGMLYAFLFLSNFVILQIGFILSILLYCMKKTKKWRSLKHLCRKKNIPIYSTTDINEHKTINFLKKLNCDYFISINFSQKIEKEALTIPKNGSINVHPGILPKYKGILPYFWSIFKREKHTGVTIHYMNEKLDEGRVIAQEKVKIKKIDSVLKVFLKTTASGASLLKKVLEKTKIGAIHQFDKLKTAKERIEKTKNKNYYSLPMKEHLRDFFRRKKTFFRFRDIKHASYE